MENNKHFYIELISLLAALVIITGVFVIAFTFAGDPENPDAVATYFEKKLSWNEGVSVSDGVAQLNIFGAPAEGEEVPVINPNSKGTYYFRLKNDAKNKIGYSVYLYNENAMNIPLEFHVADEDTSTEPSSLPSELAGKNLLAFFEGETEGKNLKNFKLEWEWRGNDQYDTALGIYASDNELLYEFKMLIVVEDNSVYSSVTSESGVRLLHRKYISGYTDGTFKPDNNMARSEVSAIFARILSGYDEGNLTSTKTSFNDVASGDWFSKYIARLSETGIIKGYDDGTFKPDNPITRAEFATMCVRFYESDAGKIKNAKSDFTDVSSGHWAKDFIDKAAKQGFITGYPDGSYKPDNNITRAEVVTVINRMLSRYPDKKYIDKNLGNMTVFNDVTDNSHWAYYEIYEAANEHQTRVDKKTESWLSAK